MQKQLQNVINAIIISVLRVDIVKSIEINKVKRGVSFKCITINTVAVNLLNRVDWWLPYTLHMQGVYDGLYNICYPVCKAGFTLFHKWQKFYWFLLFSEFFHAKMVNYWNNRYNLYTKNSTVTMYFIRKTTPKSIAFIPWPSLGKIYLIRKIYHWYDTCIIHIQNLNMLLNIFKRCFGYAFS